MTAAVYRLSIVIAFMTIFAAKMVCTVMPALVFSEVSAVKPIVADFDQDNEPDLHQDFTPEGDLKDLLKPNDHKSDYFYLSNNYILLPVEPRIRNCYTEHPKRYVNLYHPSVATPPPNSLQVSKLN